MSSSGAVSLKSILKELVLDKIILWEILNLNHLFNNEVKLNKGASEW